MAWLWCSLFGVAAAALAWTYAGYPLSMELWARLRPRGHRTGAFGGKAVALMASRGEGRRLTEKIRELLALADAGEPLAEVWAGLDGEGADAVPGLEELAAGDPRVRVVPCGERRGKPSVLNALMAAAGAGDSPADVFVMMDVRQRIEAGAVGKLLETFADDRVGVASGELVYETPGGGVQKGAQSYWSYEKRLRLAESRVWAVPGATGAFYAIRRELCRPLPPETLDDDVWLPMQAVLAGKRCLFVPGAVAWDVAEARFDREGRRKLRTLAGNWQLPGLEPGLLSVRGNPIFFRWLFHKMARLLTPFWSGLAMVSAGALAWCGVGWWRGLFAAMVAGMLLCAASAQAARRVKSRLVGLLGTVWTLHAVLLNAAWIAARGKYEVRWKG